jgi:hypothetical protein
MARPNPIRSIMATPLPSVWIQKRKPFRPDAEFVNYAYNTLNKYVFENELVRPEIKLSTLRKTWGWCLGGTEYEPSGSMCVIRLYDKWYTPSWFMNILAHEMAHQYQWDVLGPEREDCGHEAIMSHGPSFFIWKDRFEHYGLTLKTAPRIRKWFRYQDFSKC